MWLTSRNRKSILVTVRDARYERTTPASQSLGHPSLVRRGVSRSDLFPRSGLLSLLLTMSGGSRLTVSKYTRFRNPHIRTSTTYMLNCPVLVRSQNPNEFSPGTYPRHRPGPYRIHPDQLNGASRLRESLDQSLRWESGTDHRDHGGDPVGDARRGFRLLRRRYLEYLDRVPSRPLVPIARTTQSIFRYPWCAADMAIA